MGLLCCPWQTRHECSSQEKKDGQSWYSPQIDQGGRHEVVPDQVRRDHPFQQEAVSKTYDLRSTRTFTAWRRRLIPYHLVSTLACDVYTVFHRCLSNVILSTCVQHCVYVHLCVFSVLVLEINSFL